MVLVSPFERGGLTVYFRAERWELPWLSPHHSTVCVLEAEIAEPDVYLL